MQVPILTVKEDEPDSTQREEQPKAEAVPDGKGGARLKKGNPFFQAGASEQLDGGRRDAASIRRSAKAPSAQTKGYLPAPVFQCPTHRHQRQEWREVKEKE